jgi:hypothetical protein
MAFADIKLRRVGCPVISSGMMWTRRLIIAQVPES